MNQRWRVACWTDGSPINSSKRDILNVKKTEKKRKATYQELFRFFLPFLLGLISPRPRRALDENCRHFIVLAIAAIDFNMQSASDRVKSEATCRRLSWCEVLWLPVSLQLHPDVEEERPKRGMGSLQMEVMVVRGAGELLTFLPMGPSGPRSPAGPGKPCSCQDSRTSTCYTHDRKLVSRQRPAPL